MIKQLIDALEDAAYEWSGYVVEDVAPTTLQNFLKPHIESLSAQVEVQAREIEQLRAQLAPLQGDDDLPDFPPPKFGAEHWEDEEVIAYARQAQAMVRAKMVPLEKDTALRKVLAVIQEYLPPDGIKAEEAIHKIIGLVDPWPTTKKAAPLADEKVSLIAHNLDDGDWNDLRHRDCWHKGFHSGFREAEKEHGITGEPK